VIIFIRMLIVQFQHNGQTLAVPKRATLKQLASLWGVHWYCLEFQCRNGTWELLQDLQQLPKQFARVRTFAPLPRVKLIRS
jgi:hypothetical protein